MLENQPHAKIVGLVVLVIRLTSVCIAAGLHSMYTADYLDWLDDVQLRQERMQQAVFRTVLKEASGTPDTCRARGIRAKYGVDLTDMEAQEARDRRSSLLYLSDDE